MKLADLLATHAPASPQARDLMPNLENNTAPVRQTILELFRGCVRLAPDAEAVGSPDRQLTYAELDRRSDQLALRLRQNRVRYEEFVPLIMTRSPRVVIAMLAVLKAGAAYVPILPTDPLERIEYIVRDTGGRVLVSEAGLEDLVESLQRAIPGSAEILVSDESQVFSDSAAFGSKPRANDPEVTSFLAFDSPDDAVARLPERISPKSLAYVMYTSGTSGRPKGVMIEQRSIVQLVIDAGYIQIRASDRILQAGSLAFDAATFEIWGALLNGASVYVAPKDVFLRPDRLAALIRHEHITILFLTTALFNQLTDASINVFEGVRVLLTGGECVSANHMMRLRRHYPGLELLHVYGPTENTTFTTSFPVDGEFELDVPIGRPIGRNTVSVLNSAWRPQPVGVPGELCTGGLGLARGYLNDPGLTAEKFIPNPAGNGERIYRTGDLACWIPEHGPDPVLEFRGRIDDQVKIRGFRIEPGEVEARLREIACVRDAAVIVQNTEQTGKSLVAYLIGDAQLDTAAVRKACKGMLPEYMLPGDFVVLDRFPLNANGKIDRNALPAPALKSRDAIPDPAPPAANSALAQLRAIWEEVLGRSDFGEEDDFFDLGGHSLLAVQMVSLVGERLQVELPVDAVFDAPTLRELTQYLLDSARFGLAALDDGMVLMSGDPAQGSIFAFPPGMADCLGYSELAWALNPYAFYGFTFIEDKERIARYADLIQSTPAVEPYILFGYSSGGNLAYHVAGALESRGRVVKSVIMLDSARHLAPLNIPFERMKQAADDFLSTEAAQKYLTSAILRDKAFRNITRNLEYVSSCVDMPTVKADIHLIECEDSQLTHTGENGETILSKPAWETATAGSFLSYQGAGGHDYMLHLPHFERNAKLILSILEGKAQPKAKSDALSFDPAPAASKLLEIVPEVFERLESRVRSYCRVFPTVFETARGAYIYDRTGKAYIDFFCGAGTLNYGHNPPAIKNAIKEYLESDGVIHSLDMATVAKERFLAAFEALVLKPRQLGYRIQFVGPTGANGVEASLKLARKVKRRSTIVAFTNAYHGLSNGALSVTAKAFYRGQFYTPPADVVFMPFDGYLGDSVDTLDYFERCLSDQGSGLGRPAAVIVETVQAEGGVNVARVEWLQRLQELCHRFEMLLIVDDIQVGCGRTGTFFSFERAGLYPDIVVLSKSISGFGMPMSLVLLKPDLDVWEVGEHTGTFRGNNLAFVAATKALDFWQADNMSQTVSERSIILAEKLSALADKHAHLDAQVRGIGLIFGLQFQPPNLVQLIAQESFKRGVIVELCGPRDNVLKFLPPLIIDPSVLHEGLDRIREATETVLKSVAVG
jgi:diaminobutyrate--2-oxoglutarate aminotransferase